MTSSSSPNDKFRVVVREEISRINRVASGDDREKLPAMHRRKEGYGAYNGTHELNLHWLAELVSRRMNQTLTTDEVHSMVRLNARSLPRDPDLRQELLECTQDVLADCAHRRGMEAFDADLVELCMDGGSDTPSLLPLGFDPESLGFFRISMWNANRPMVEERNVGEIKPVVRTEELAQFGQYQDWVQDQALYDRLLAEARARNMGSPCPALVGYQVDDRETDRESWKLRLRVSETVYSTHVALRNYFRADHAAYETVRRRITEKSYVQGNSESLSEVIRSAPESNIVINVTVQSRNNRVMVIQRPTNATVWASFYQAGAHETMNWPGPQLDVENWFQLARRALKEEIGLPDPADYYDKIVFSWFGFYAPEGSGYFFAHARTRLNERQLVQAVAESEGVVEAERIDWLTLDKASIREVLRTWQNGVWEEQAIADPAGRRWLPHATMSLTQLWRVTRQGMMEIPPRP